MQNLCGFYTIFAAFPLFKHLNNIHDKRVLKKLVTLCKFDYYGLQYPDG